MVRLSVLASLLLSLVIPCNATCAPLAKEVEVNGARIQYLEDGSGGPSSSSMVGSRTIVPGNRLEMRSPANIGSSPRPSDISVPVHGKMTEGNSASRPLLTISPSL